MLPLVRASLLLVLELRSGHIGNHGAGLVAEVLAGNTALVSLDLQRNAIKVSIRTRRTSLNGLLYVMILSRRSTRSLVARSDAPLHATPLWVALFRRLYKFRMQQA